jgi:hypothetical protein
VNTDAITAAIRNASMGANNGTDNPSAGNPLFGNIDLGNSTGIKIDSAGNLSDKLTGTFSYSGGKKVGSTDDDKKKNKGSGAAAPRSTTNLSRPLVLVN